MNRYAMIANGVVVNIAIWDGESQWDHGADEVVKVDNNTKVSIGSQWDGSVFTEGEPESTI